MNMDHGPIPTTSSYGRPQQKEARFYGSWLIRVRVAWIIVVSLAVGLFIASIPLKYTNPSYLVFSFIFEFVYIATGVVIFWHKSSDRIALVTSFALITFGTAFLGNAFIGLFFFVFPTGQLIPHWTRWLVVGWITYWGFNNLFLASFISSPGLNTVAFVCFLASVVPIQVYRYRRVSTPAQRQQTKWVIDVIINRTLVYGTRTASIITIYTLIVVLLGSLFQTSGNLLISLLATGLVAVLFQPLREHLQRAVNRLLYGERDTPYKVISRLGQRLEVTLAPEAVLPTIVETVAQALKLPYAAITLKQGGKFVTTASYGSPKDEIVSLPLNYQAELIGELVRSGMRALLAATDDLKVVGEAATGEEAVSLATSLQPEVVVMDLRAIRAVGSGDAIFSATIAQRLIDFFAAPFPELTDREREILSLIAQGRSNNDIAQTLVISMKTVRNYISSIFSKLQVADRAQAILRAREAGLG